MGPVHMEALSGVDCYGPDEFQSLEKRSIGLTAGSAHRALARSAERLCGRAGIPAAPAVAAV